MTMSDLSDQSPAPLAVLRPRWLTGLTLAITVFGLWGYAGPLMSALQGRQWVVLGLAAAAVLWLVVASLLPRLSYRLRAGSLLALVMALGLADLATEGPGGPAVGWFVTAAVLGAMLFGHWGGVASLGLGLLSLIAVAWLTQAGRLPLAPQSAAVSALGWGPPMVALVLASIAIALTLAALLHASHTAATEERKRLAQLEEEKRALEARVGGGAEGRDRLQARLETAAEIARLASQTQDASELMARAVERIRERFDFYHASIFLLDATGLWADLVASTGEAGRQLLARKHRLAVGSASIIGWVTANQKPRVAQDVEKDPFHFKNPLLPGTRSEAAVPILAGNRLLGALDVQSTQPEAFAAEDVSALEAIASELAIALESLRLMREAAAGPQAAGAAGAAASWQRLARRVEAAEVHLRGAAADGLPPGPDVAREAAERGEIVVAEGGHEMAVPISVRGEVVATIAARKPESEPPFDEEDMAVLQAVASQTGQALETARQYAEEQRRLAELEVVNRVSQAASQLLNVEALYRVLHNQVRQVLGETDIIVALFDEEHQRVQFPYVAKGNEIREGGEVDLGNDAIAHVLRTRQPLLLTENIEAQAAALDLVPPEKGITTWLGVPMLVGEVNIGVLAVQSRDAERHFTDDDAALLTTIASQVATALENARLLDEVRRAARRQRLIHEITAHVRRAADIDTILMTATRELSEGLGAARAYARLAESLETPAATSELEEVG